MVEFRTEAPGENKNDSSGGLDGFLNDYIQTLKNSDTGKQQLIAFMRENEIPPALVAPAIGANPDELTALMQKMEQAEQAQEAQQQQAQQQPKPKRQMDAKEATKQELNVDKIEEIVGEIIDVKGEDTTLGELQEFVENNPDIVDNMIDLM